MQCCDKCSCVRGFLHKLEVPLPLHAWVRSSNLVPSYVPETAAQMHTAHCHPREDERRFMWHLLAFSVTVEFPSSSCGRTWMDSPPLNWDHKVSTCFLQLPLCTHFCVWLQDFPYFLDYKPHVTGSCSICSSISCFISANLTQVILSKGGCSHSKPLPGNFSSSSEGLILLQLIEWQTNSSFNAILI